MNEKSIYKLVGEYCNIVGRLGPDCVEAQEFRIINAHNEEILDLCDSIDRIKRNLGGSGISDNIHDKYEI